MPLAVGPLTFEGQYLTRSLVKLALTRFLQGDAFPVLGETLLGGQRLARRVRVQVLGQAMDIDEHPEGIAFQQRRIDDFEQYLAA